MRDVFERMVWDLAFAKKSVRTQKIYLSDAKTFAAFHGRSPEETGQPEVRVWVEHLVERQVSPSRLRQHLAALTFRYRKTLGVPQAVSFFSWPNDPEPLPVVLSPAEGAQLLAAMPTPAYHPGPARAWRALQHGALPARGHPHEQGQRGPHGTAPPTLIRGGSGRPPVARRSHRG